MPTWNADQYLAFADERTRPCRDLVSAIGLHNPGRIIDLGCGPGNSTAVLRQRWPEAQIVGIDSSPAMITAATTAWPDGQWQVADIGRWSSPEPADLAFSNAALQWVGDHPQLLPRLMQRVAPGGALAIQVPINLDAPAHCRMRELAASPAWQAYFPSPVREWFVHPPATYYDLLSPLAGRVDLWTTEYLHVLPSPQAIVEWYKGTGLRPFLDALSNDADRQRFLGDYLKLIETDYLPRADGKVLFPFNRLFVIAYRPDTAVRW